MSTIIGLVSTFRLPLHLTASKSNPYNFTLPRCSHFSNPQKNKSNASIVVLPALLCSLHI